MKPSYVDWLFSEQLKEQEQRARSVPKVIPAPERRTGRSLWRNPLARRRSRLGQAAPVDRAPIGCSV